MASTPEPHGRTWYAKWDGDKLACVHEYWCDGSQYHDKWIVPSRSKCEKYVDRMRQSGKVVVTKDKVTENGAAEPGFKRRGYLRVVEVEDITYNERDGLRFRFGRTLADFR